MPADGYLAVSLHAGTDRSVCVGNIHAGHKDTLLGFHLALWTHDRHIASKSAQREAFEFDGCGLTAPEQRGIIFGNSDVHDDRRTFNNLRKSVAMHEAAANGVLYLRCGHDPVERGTYGGAIQSF